jgi:hypothetical protein
MRSHVYINGVEPLHTMPRMLITTRTMSNFVRSHPVLQFVACLHNMPLNSSFVEITQGCKHQEQIAEAQPLQHLPKLIAGISLAQATQSKLI